MLCYIGLSTKTSSRSVGKTHGGRHVTRCDLLRQVDLGMRDFASSMSQGPCMDMDMDMDMDGHGYSKYQKLGVYPIIVDASLSTLPKWKYTFSHSGSPCSVHSWHS